MRLAREADLAIVGEAGDCATTLRVAPRLAPDVVLLDLELPDGDGVELCVRLLQRMPGLGCVILSLFDSAHHRQRAQAAGAAAFVGKQEPTDVLLSAIRRVAACRQR